MSTTTFSPSSSRPEANLKEIRRQLDEALQEFNSLDMRPGASLCDFEYRVKQCSDKIASLKIAEKLQLQLINQSAREAETELQKKSS
jgi:hypothetical protein